MPTIATLTMNPTIDAGYEVDRLVPTHKLRSHAERYDPGGGGINVARVFVRLGGKAECHYLSGGATGTTLDGLLDLHRLVRRETRIAGATRVACNIFERESGREFRIVPEGPPVSEAEWQQCLTQLDTAECDYLILSGSLPPGVPEDFYAHVAQRARARGIKPVLDSSGEALHQGLSGSAVYLAKPSLAELEGMVGSRLQSVEAIGAAAQELVAARHAELIAVTLGSQGALLASSDQIAHFPAIPVIAKSAVGAGDSFLAAMIYALSTGYTPLDAFRFGMAAGSAAVLTPGTDLARPEDIARLYAAEPAAPRDS